jgi:hypothetical protein
MILTSHDTSSRVDVSGQHNVRASQHGALILPGLEEDFGTSTSQPTNNHILNPVEEDLSDVFYEQWGRRLNIVMKVSIDQARCGSHKYTYRQVGI